MLQNKKFLASEEVVEVIKELTATINDITCEKKPDVGSPSIWCLIGSQIFESCL